MSDEDIRQQEGTNLDEEQNLDEQIEDTDDVDALKEALEKERIAKQQILARAKKAEAEAKELKTKANEKPSQNINNTLTAEDVEVKILKAQGLSEDEISYLKKLAVINQTTIIEAQNDDIYQAYKNKKQEAEKAEKAKLGASRGSGTVKQSKTVSSEGLTDAEHKQLWREAMNK